MTDTEQDLLAAALDELADSPAPTSSLDAGRALREGGRLRTRRRLARGGVALACAAALTAAITVVSQHGTPPGPAAPAPAASPHRPGSAGPQDTATAPASFGWLPTGVAAGGYWPDPDLTLTLPALSVPVAVAFGAQPAPGSTLHPMLDLYVYPQGQPPVPAKSTWPYSLPAPDVNARPATWYTTSRTDPLNTATPMLRWRTADGRTAVLTADNFPAKGLAQLLLRTAAGIELNDVSVPLPYYLTGWHLQRESDTAMSPSSDLQRFGEQTWQMSTVFSVPGSGYEVDLGLWHGSGAPNTERPPNPHEPAACATSQGIVYCVSPVGAGKPPAALAAVGGLKGLLAKVTVLGPDPKNWTTDVLR